MKQKFIRSVLRYLEAMNATALQSAVHTLRIYCGMAGCHEITSVSSAPIAIPAINVQQAGCVFLIAFAAAVLNYLDAHPVPIITITTVPAAAAAPMPFTSTGTPPMSLPGTTSNPPPITS